MALYTNPEISENVTWKEVVYLDTRCAIFTCNGNPENVIAANTGSLALSDDGNVYKKTTDDVDTGWINLSGGGGGGADTDLGNLVATAINQSLIPDTTNAIDLGSLTLLWRNILLAGWIRIDGTGQFGYVTPIGNIVPTKIAIVNFDPGAFGQIIAMGLNSSANSSARVISLFDQRAAGHQPTLQVFNPSDEGELFGLTWDGSDTIAQILTTAILRLNADRVIMSTPSTAPTDSDIPNNNITMRLDEGANQLSIRVRYSDGSLHTGTVNLV
jgi:hypothetical protein